MSQDYLPVFHIYNEQYL